MISFKLINQQVRDRAKLAIQDAPDNYVVQINEQVRNLEQNDKLHALLREVSNSGKKWAGKERTVDEWKTIFVSGFMHYKHADGRSYQDHGELIQDTEGQIVSLIWKTSGMSKSMLSELIEYIEAWWAENA